MDRIEASDLPTLSHWRERAEAVLSAEAWDYLETGAGTEVSLAEAETDWADYRFRPRVLRDVGRVDTAVSLAGVDLAAPILIAPTAGHAYFHSDAEVGTASGAREAGALYAAALALCAQR